MAENMDDWATSYGFIPAKRAGGLVFFSGVVGMNEDGSVPEDPKTQFELAFAALDAVLDAEGLSKSKLVDLVSFHADYPNNVETFIAAKKDYLGEITTTWTAVGATLGSPETLVEVRAIAEA